MADSGPDVYAGFVQTLVDSETARKASIEAKGSAVIATSASLVTLLFGLVAVITSSKGFKLPTMAHSWLVAAIVSFVVATGTAILVSFPLPYGQTTITTNDLRRWWGDSAAEAEAAVAGVRLRALAAARRANAVKAMVLCLASAAELLALIMLVVAVLKIIDS